MRSTVRSIFHTHSIAWALHGLKGAKDKRSDASLLGNKIDRQIEAGRYGQTNGIAQGSAAELLRV